MVGRRERKKQVTRAALSSAAVRLSLRDGVQNVTVEQIADEADVALRTFFNYFSSKEEAVVAADAERGELLVERFRARPGSESVLAAVRAAVLAHLDELAADDDRDALRAMRRSPALLGHQLAVYAATERALAVAVAERVEGRAADGEAAGADNRVDDADRADAEDAPVGLYPALVAAMTMAGVRVAVTRWTDLDTGRDAERLRGIAAEVFDGLARGLDDPAAFGLGVSLPS